MVDGGIRIDSVSFLRGPNVHALFPVMEAVLDLGSLVETPSNKSLSLKLLSCVPGLEEHSCSLGYQGGFVERLFEGTYPAHISEHTAIALQCELGSQVHYGKTREMDSGVYKIVMAYESEEIAKECLDLAVWLVSRIFTGRSIEEFPERFDKIKKQSLQEQIGPSTRAILDAAKDRGIPYSRISPQYNLFAFGWGIKQKRMWATVSSETSALACDIGQDKALTKCMLQDVGLPVPRGRVVSSLEEALEEAAKIPGPILIKPKDGHHGNGVMGNLRTTEEISLAVEVAKHHGPQFMVEEFLQGEDHRFLVVGGNVVAVAKRTPAHIIGDGTSNIVSLVEYTNSDPSRGKGHESRLTELRLESEELQFLAGQGLAPDFVPGMGEVIFLRAGGNLSSGGTAEDVTDLVHHSLITTAEQAARILEIDIAGVDIITTDITRPLSETGGAIIEVNAGPGLRMHLDPSKGSSRPVGEALVEHLFPRGDGRIPLISITGTNGKTTTSRMLEWIAQTAGFSPGLAVTGGIWINGDKVASGDTTGPHSARRVLSDHSVDFAILETARGGILRRGLGFDKARVGVVLNIREDHIGVDGIEGLEDLFWIKSVVTEAVEDDGFALLNAEDPFTPRLMERAKGKLVLFSKTWNDLLKEHTSNGGRAFWSDGNTIWASLGDSPLKVGDISSAPCLYSGVPCMMENSLAALASAYCAGMYLRTAWAGLCSFVMDESTNPGRLNTFVADGVTIVLDYAHNPDCFRALGEYVHAINGNNNNIVFSVPGDRQDEMLEKCGATVAKYFDDIVITENSEILRGRTKGEIPHLVSKGIQAKGKTSRTFLDMEKAVTFMLSAAEPGDVIAIADLDLTMEDTKRLMETARGQNIGQESVIILPPIV